MAFNVCAITQSRHSTGKSLGRTTVNGHKSLYYSSLCVIGLWFPRITDLIAPKAVVIRAEPWTDAAAGLRPALVDRASETG